MKAGGHSSILAQDDSVQEKHLQLLEKSSFHTFTPKIRLLFFLMMQNGRLDPLKTRGIQVKVLHV